MAEEQYIVFAEKTGSDESGNNFYRLLTSNDPEIVWGDNFEQTPAGVIPDLEPDSQSINNEYLLTTKLDLKTAVDSTWFSLQDCIDGIIALLFCGEGEKIVNIPFGMPMNDVKHYVLWFEGDLKKMEYTPKEEKKEKEDGEEES
jgi:hypothetical protein